MRARLILRAVVLAVLVGIGIAAVRLLGGTEVLHIVRVDARSDDVDLIVIASHNDCNNEPTARIVDQTSDAVTVRVERRRNFPADTCDDTGLETPSG